MRRYEEAITTLKKVITRNPNHLSAHNDLAVIYIDLGREEEARAEVAETLRVNPEYSLKVIQSVPFKDPAEAKRWLDNLRRAGLPEEQQSTVSDRLSAKRGLSRASNTLLRLTAEGSRQDNRLR